MCVPLDLVLTLEWLEQHLHVVRFDVALGLLLEKEALLTKEQASAIEAHEATADDRRREAAPTAHSMNRQATRKFRYLDGVEEMLLVVLLLRIDSGIVTSCITTHNSIALVSSHSADSPVT